MLRSFSASNQLLSLQNTATACAVTLHINVEQYKCMILFKISNKCTLCLYLANKLHLKQELDLTCTVNHRSPFYHQLYTLFLLLSVTNKYNQFFKIIYK